MPIFFATALACWSVTAAEDSPSLQQVYEPIYNLDFDRAGHLLDRWGQKNENDPRLPMTHAAIILFREFQRLDILEAQFFVDDEEFKRRDRPEPDPELRERFYRQLNRTETMAQARLETSPENVDALFSMTLASGLRADYLSLIAKRDMDALNAAKKASTWADRLLAADPEYYDAYLATGIANYLVGDLFAPVRWILSLAGYSGDKKKGIEQLNTTAEKGHLLAPYARILLAIVHLREDKPQKAREILAGLRDQFPGNPLFAKEIDRLDKKLGEE